MAGHQSSDLAAREIMSSNKRTIDDDNAGDADDESREISDQKRVRRNSTGMSNPPVEETTEHLAYVEGACWRCRLRREPCTGETPCTRCLRAITQRGPFRTSAVMCHRDDLKSRLTDKIPNIRGFGGGEWYIPTRDGHRLRICIKCETPQVDIRDFDLEEARKAPLPQFKRSVVDFLGQFDQLNCRWPMNYEPLTESIISICVKIQETCFLAKLANEDEAFSDEDFIVLKALRALRLAHYFGVLTAVLPNGYDRTTPANLYTDPHVEMMDFYSVTIWQCPETLDTAALEAELSDGTELSTMIQEIVALTERVLFRNDAKDWPMIMSVLCILKLSFDELNGHCMWVTVFDKAQAAIENVWRGLCQLYNICAKGHLPLSHEWDKAKYAGKVQEDKIAVAHFQLWNLVWRQEDFDEDNGNLQTKLEYFLGGYMAD